MSKVAGAKKRLRLLAPVATPHGPGMVLKECGPKGETVVSVPLRPGKPVLPGLEVVTLEAIDDEHFDSETIVEASGLAHSGPAQVATETYRENWEEIFGKRGAPSSLN